MPLESQKRLPAGPLENVMDREDVQKTRYRTKDLTADRVLEGILRALDYISPKNIEKRADMREKVAEMKREGFNDLWIIAETGVFGD